MTRQRLEAILAAYGGNPERWPGAERGAALALIESGEARLSVGDEADLDVVLASAERPVASNMLKANLLEAAAMALSSEDLRSRAVRRPQRSWLVSGLTRMFEGFLVLKPLSLGAAMVPVLVLGIWIGAILTSEPIGEDELFAAFGEDYDLWTQSDTQPATETTGEI
jgi:hypothetical protein